MPEAHRFGHVLFFGGGGEKICRTSHFLKWVFKISIKLVYPYLHEHNKIIMNTYLPHLPSLKSTQLLH